MRPSVLETKPTNETTTRHHAGNSSVLRLRIQSTDDRRASALRGKTTEQLRAGLGEPTRIVKEPDGSEVWEYVSEGEFVREHISPGKFQNVNRYLIKDGKVKKWIWERSENGEVVKRDH